MRDQRRVSPVLSTYIWSAITTLIEVGERSVDPRWLRSARRGHLPGLVGKLVGNRHPDAENGVLVAPASLAMPKITSTGFRGAVDRKAH